MKDSGRKKERRYGPVGGKFPPLLTNGTPTIGTVGDPCGKRIWRKFHNFLSIGSPSFCIDYYKSTRSEEWSGGFTVWTGNSVHVWVVDIQESSVYHLHYKTVTTSNLPSTWKRQKTPLFGFNKMDKVNTGFSFLSRSLKRVFSSEWRSVRVK